MPFLQHLGVGGRRKCGGVDLVKRSWEGGVEEGKRRENVCWFREEGDDVGEGVDR